MRKRELNNIIGDVTDFSETFITSKLLALFFETVALSLWDSAAKWDDKSEGAFWHYFTKWAIILHDIQKLTGASIYSLGKVCIVHTMQENKVNVLFPLRPIKGYI